MVQELQATPGGVLLKEADAVATGAFYCLILAFKSGSANQRKLPRPGVACRHPPPTPAWHWSMLESSAESFML